MAAGQSPDAIRNLSDNNLYNNNWKELLGVATSRLSRQEIRAVASAVASFGALLDFANPNGRFIRKHCNHPIRI